MQFSDKLLSDAEICYQDVQENAICIQKTNLQQRNALKGDAFFFTKLHCQTFPSVSAAETHETFAAGGSGC